jgi:hypothetical protein
MQRLRPLLYVLASTLIVIGGSQAAHSNDDDGCSQINATGIGQDLGNGNTIATIRQAGFLNGTTSGHFDISGDPPVFTINGTVVFTAKHGTLTVNLSGTFNVATGEFTASGPVAGGTGKLAGATGNLTFTGVENLETGAFTETITGTVCKPGGDDQ